MILILPYAKYVNLKLVEAEHPGLVELIKKKKVKVKIWRWKKNWKKGQILGLIQRAVATKEKVIVRKSLLMCQYNNTEFEILKRLERGEWKDFVCYIDGYRNLITVVGLTGNFILVNELLSSWIN
ncbi:MAG: hypothetical protein ABIF17_03255 [Patescibacteria group bacterium]